jgi:hypothetical protein
MWFFAEKRATIDNPNFRLHRAVEVKNSERYVIYVICYFRTNNKLSHLYRVSDVLPSETSYRKGERFDVEIDEPYHHRVEKVSVAENVTIEEPIIHQPQSYHTKVICYLF